MSYNYPEIKEFSGLFLQANSLTVPDGAMEIASNIVIKNDNVIQKIPGAYTYFNPSPSDMNQLFFYKDRLLAIYSNKLTYFTDTGSSPNITGTESTLSGQTIAVTGTRVSRSVEANNNLYMTTDNGILKLEDYNSTIYIAGAPPGLDVSAKILPTSVGPLSPNRTVGYRIIFGRKDGNDNLIIGAPSNIATIYIPQDITSTTTPSSAAYTSTGAGPYTVTVTTTFSHGLTTGDEIITSSSGATDADALGTFTIIVTSATTFTYSTVGDPSSGTLRYTFTRSIRLESSVPSEITSGFGWFFQVYRSSQATGNVTPQQDYKLIGERTLTSAEITSQIIFFTDDVDDILLGAELYTNPNSREGELQSNFKPPKSEDVTFYKNSVLYSNCQTRHLLNFDVIDPGNIAANDFIDFQIGSVARRYIARISVSNQTVSSQSITNSGGDLRVDYVSHGFANNDSLYISNITGGTLTEGTYYVVSTAANTFKISTTIGGSAVAFNSETRLDFEGIIHPVDTAGSTWTRTSSVVTVTSAAHNLTSGMTLQITASASGSPNVTLANYTITVTGTNTFTFVESAADSSGTLTYRVNVYMFALNNTSTSVSVQLRTTAQGIVKAVNRDPSSLMYANYTSTTIPGQMRFMAKGFTSAIYVRASTALVGTGFLPTIPVSFSSGTQVFSASDVELNAIYVSKTLEPEAVPIINKYNVGSRAKRILRTVALRDSTIIVKEDGIFRLTGDVPAAYTITILDSTVICLAASSVKLLNNEVILLSNQGVCRITESSVQIVSRRIDDVIQPILGSSVLAAQTSAISYESERLYFLTTILPGSTTADQTYCFNVLNESWTTSSFLIKQGLIGPSDRLFFIDSNADLMKQRKDQTKTDFSGQNTTVTVTAVSSNSMTITVNSSALIESGDMFVLSNIISRVYSVTVAGSSYTCTFRTTTNLVVSDTPILYKRVVSNWRMAPFHGGQVGRMKQFAQMQLHLRDENFTRAFIYFTGYSYGGSEVVDWSAFDIPTSEAEGWGDNWGLSPWGAAESISITQGTKPAPVCRIYIPLVQQRTTFLQPDVTHEEAGEAINIQAQSYAVRSYQERVSR